LTWKYQHPPRGRTGDSFPWLFPLITRTSGPSGPSGKALGMLYRDGSTSPSSRRTPKLPAYLPFRFELLVRRFYHLILLRQVNPKLKAARFGLARFLDGHLSMDNCEITLSTGFDRETLLRLKTLTSASLSSETVVNMARLTQGRRRRGTYRAHPLHATFSNDTRMSCRVLVFAGTLSNVGDCSLAAMWVVRETL
jgi:hypothetical protein